MSYSSPHNAGDFYGSNQGGRNKKNSYTTASQQATYPGGIGHSRYISSGGYDWGSQPQQQDYPSSSRQRTTYGGDGWTDPTGQSTSHDERAEASNYGTEAVAGTSAHNYYT